MPTDSSSSSKSEDEASEEEHTMSEEEASSSSKGDEWWWSRKVKRDAISPSATYPYLLVTIGTGVSILRVDGPRKHVRVSGSTIGGGTYWGLIRLLTNIDDFQKVLSLAERGDSSKADMMVGDIYGTDSKALEKVGLPSNLVASSFGKLVAKADPAEGLSQEDMARALLLMVTNNIGQVAYLNAKLNNTPRIYFVGNFLRNNKISQRRLSYAIDYWSKGEMEALFLEREGYLGALGAFLLCQGISQTDSGFFQRDAENSSRSQDSD
jgi:type II pantothenate kinase